MTIRLNGEERELPAGATVAAAVALLDVTEDSRGVAVAVDREVVPRGAWSEHVVADGARVEVLTAIQGG